MRFPTATLGLLLSLVAAMAWGQTPAPIGSEFLVNTYTTSEQYNPQVALGSDGAFIVVWDSRGSSATDTDGTSIQGQRYDPGGAPNGAQFQINTFTTYWQSAPDVGIDADGKFVVVWQGPNPSDLGNDFGDIRGQRFAASGSPLGAEFRINSYSTGDQHRPVIAVAADGRFVVVWDGVSPTEHGAGIFAQRFAADATPLGPEFKINTYTTESQRFPAISMATNGHFVVVWESNGSAGPDSDFKSVQGQRVAANGALLGGEFQVNTYTTRWQYAASVAMDTGGDFVVVWESYGSSGSDISGMSVQGQRFAEDGTPLGDEFQVNSYTTRNQRSAEVATVSEGGFVVTWESYGSSGTDVDDGVPPDRAKESVQMRHFSSDGIPSGEDFQVNTYTPNQQWNPAISANHGPQFVVVWESRGDDPSNYLPFGVRGQRLDETAVFADGFETADISAWSNAATCGAGCPVANFVFVTIGLTVDFFNTTTGDFPLAYFWNFDDGSPISTEQDPMHVYGSAGTYDVSLTAFNSSGSDSIVKSVTVNP